MNLRFKLGEMAVYGFKQETHRRLPVVGQIVTVTKVGPFKPHEDAGNGYSFSRECDYAIDTGTGIAGVRDYQLIKIIDPDATETIEEDAEVHA